MLHSAVRQAKKYFCRFPNKSQAGSSLPYNWDLASLRPRNHFGGESLPQAASAPSGQESVTVSSASKTWRISILGKTVCLSSRLRWLALHWSSEGCSDGPSRSSSQEDEPWQIIEKLLSESMLPN